ncbi:MAG: Ig-like domain-containing protein, partial [Anaerolineae bacterium]
MRTKLWVGTLLLAALFVLSSFGFMALADHGPPGSHLVAVGPVSPENGFPLWYKDANGLALELCLDHQNPLCNFLPGDVPDPTQPVSFPDNFPGEAFWWSADAIMDTNNIGDRALVVLGLEATFVNGIPVEGEQISFGRVRIWADTTVPGVYTVTHPFGVNVFQDVAPGKNGIKFTEDIGIGVPGDFSGALNSRVAPFLTWDPISEAPPGFIGNPLFDHKITGSLFGTNFYRIEGPPGSFVGSPFLCADPTLGADPTSTTDCIETDMFALTGKVRTNAGVGVAAATYANNPGGGAESLNVFAFSEAGQALQVSGPGIAITDMEGNGAGQYFARVEFDGAGPPPAQITVANIGDNPSSTVTAAVVDVVTISQAQYDTDTNTLAVTAASSDLDTPPTLDIYDNNGTLLGSVAAGGTFVQTLGVPPPSVSVVSTAGGVAEEPVSVVGSSFLPTNLAPSVTVLSPASGDLFVSGDPINFSGVATDPEDGDLSAGLIWNSSVDGPIGTGASLTTALSPGVHIITASAIDSAGLPGSASVTITVTSVGGNTPPDAAPDGAATTGMLPVTIDVLTNDSDDVGVDPATVVVGVASDGGAIVVNPDGTLTFTPGPNAGTSPVAHGPVHPAYGYPVWYQDSSGLAGTSVFTYTVRDTQGAISNEATVSVTLNPMTLELCLDDEALCGLAVTPPVSFPDNFPQESFWWSAEATVPTTAGGNAILVLAVGAGFVDDGPIVHGNQESFARTRLLATGLVPGATYQATHPYGVDTFVADANGEISFTADLGDLPGVFSGALNQFSGPFLVWDASAPAPPAGYIGDPLVLHTVTGSPFGTNFFRLEGPGLGIVETDQFSVIGKLTTAATGPNDTPPGAAISVPPDGASFEAGTSIIFSGSASDAEEGDLSANLVWTSDLIGQIGTGASISVPLPEGVHIITASVIDSGGLTASASVSVIITAPNTAPGVVISSPANGDSFVTGTSI